MFPRRFECHIVCSLADMSSPIHAVYHARRDFFCALYVLCNHHQLGIHSIRYLHPD